MNARVVLAALAAVVVGAAVLLLWPKQQLTPEEQVRAMIAGCVAAAEQRDVASITEHVADDFQGPSGARKEDVKQILLGQLFRQQQGGVLIMNPALEVTMESETAGAFAGTFVFARPGQDWQAPGSGVSRYEIDGKVVKRADEWLIVSAEWRR